MRIRPCLCEIYIKECLTKEQENTFKKSCFLLKFVYIRRVRNVVILFAIVLKRCSSKCGSSGTQNLLCFIRKHLRHNFHLFPHYVELMKIYISQYEKFNSILLPISTIVFKLFLAYTSYYNLY